MTASARLTSAGRAATAAATRDARSAVTAATIACSRLEKELLYVLGDTPAASAMSSTRTFSGPRSSARRSAAARSASLVACFFRSRKLGRFVVTPSPSHITCAHAKMRARKNLIASPRTHSTGLDRKGPTHMRAKGMTYDTGFVRDGSNSLERFDPELVRRELTIIRDDLHCNAVQIVGG